MDSNVTLGVIAKGRTSSKRLRRVLGKINAVTLVGHFTVTVGFCRSEHNPADRPSRQFKKRPRRGAPHFGKIRSSESEGDGPRPKGVQKKPSGQIVARGRVLDVASKAS